MDLLRLGRAVRAIRRKRSWRQADLARAAGLSRTVVGRIERGESGAISVCDLNAAVTALDGTLDVLLRWKGEELDRLLDEGHATIVERLVAWLRAHGWEVALEVSFNRYGERGSIDVLAFHPGSRALAVFEVKSVTPDMQSLLGRLDVKVRLGPEIARGRGWRADVVAKILVIDDTSTNRRRLARFGSTVEAALPAGTWEVRRWLEHPGGGGIAGIWFLPNDREAARNRGGRTRVRVPREQPRTTSHSGSAR